MVHNCIQSRDSSAFSYQGISDLEVVDAVSFGQFCQAPDRYVFVHENPNLSEKVLDLKREAKKSCQ